MKLIWYLISLIIICLILINNPKGTNLGSFGNQGSILNATRSNQKTLQILIVVNIFCFFLLTILLLLYSLA
uniref:Probable protein-export membrane protein SecG n=1 Tax=Mastocarpus papillatus TaxID=31436 RepID=A0A342RZJ5_9FLOR|nr:preprotein translocase subunit G [Mastocarpus papillatus]AOL58141.1 preprotein translocase subunit G [Mastocarpus papillatus]